MGLDHNFRQSKYKAKKTVIDGIRFDSRKEASRYSELKIMLKAGLIADLELQKRFLLIPSQKDPETGKVAERACYYVADFVYQENGRTVVEDVKSEATKTPVYRLKKKLMLYRYGIRIQEI